MDSPDLGYYEFCPLLDSVFGPFIQKGRGRIMTRKDAIRLYERWRRLYGPGALFYTPIHQKSLVVHAVESVPVEVE